MADLATFIVRRLCRAVAVIFGVTVAVFIVTHLIGDPARLILPLDASHSQYLALREKLGENDSLLTQFWRFLSHAARGDFGQSLWQGTPALPLALRHVGATLALGGVAVGLGVLVGVPSGFIAALRAHSRIDKAVSGLSLLGVSVANFWLGLILILVFAVDLHWLPTSGYGARNLILPALAAAAYPFGQITQLSRAAMLEQLAQPYFVAARAKGLSRAEALALHAARNAMIPVITVAGYEFGRIVAGFVVVIETLFAWPGLGRLTFDALTRHDFPLIQACIFVMAVLVVAINLVVDVLYRLIDPRVKLV